MEWLKWLWYKLGEEKFTYRAITVCCTLMTLIIIWTVPMREEYAWFMGVLNGGLIIAQLIEEFKDDD
ncbi:MAG: hypothetical protein SR1Q5_03270 [Quinella sp. 1Q5]|nr:hypothetical protein [Quinella sp. 1Q5]